MSDSSYLPRSWDTCPSYAQQGTPDAASRPENLPPPVLKPGPAPHPLYGNVPFQSLQYMIVAVMTCFMFARHLVVLACWRALLSAGRRIEISSAMMPMT